MVRVDPIAELDVYTMTVPGGWLMQIMWKEAVMRRACLLVLLLLHDAIPWRLARSRLRGLFSLPGTSSSIHTPEILMIQALRTVTDMVQDLNLTLRWCSFRWSGSWLRGYSLVVP